MKKIILLTFIVLAVFTISQNKISAQEQAKVYIEKTTSNVYNGQIGITTNGLIDLFNPNISSFSILFFVEDLNHQKLRSCFSSEYRIFSRGNQSRFSWNINLTAMGNFSPRFKLYAVAVSNINYNNLNTVLRSTDNEFSDINSILKILYNYGITPIAYTYINK